MSRQTRAILEVPKKIRDRVTAAATELSLVPAMVACIPSVSNVKNARVVNLIAVAVLTATASKTRPGRKSALSLLVRTRGEILEPATHGEILLLVPATRVQTGESRVPVIPSLLTTDPLTPAVTRAGTLRAAVIREETLQGRQTPGETVAAIPGEMLLVTPGETRDPAARFRTHATHAGQAPAQP